MSESGEDFEIRQRRGGAFLFQTGIREQTKGLHRLARLAEFLCGQFSRRAVQFSGILFTDFRIRQTRKQVLFRKTFGEECGAGAVTSQG